MYAPPKQPKTLPQQQPSGRAQADVDGDGILTVAGGGGGVGEEACPRLCSIIYGPKSCFKANCRICDDMKVCSKTEQKMNIKKYVYIYVCVYVYIHMYIYVYIYMCVCVYMYFTFCLYDIYIYI